MFWVYTVEIIKRVKLSVYDTVEHYYRAALTVAPIRTCWQSRSFSNLDNIRIHHR